MEYSTKELEKLFEALPIELKDALLSEETAERIAQISHRYELLEEQTPELAKLVGKILLGLLPPEQVQEVLTAQLAVEPERAQYISREVNRFILFPVKEQLSELYSEIRFAPGGRLERKRAETEILKSKEAKTAADIYQETIEY